MKDARISEQRQEYLKRVNLVQDFIENHITETFTLEGLAKVSSFSKFHFHRIFTSMMGETIYHYITRQKLEKAANHILYMTDRPITEIALDMGFTDSASFARAFKRYYGVSATKYRKIRGIYNNSSMEGQKTDSKMGKESDDYPIYNVTNNINDWRKHRMNIDVNVEVKEVEAITVAYLRHIGSYEGFAEVFQNFAGQLMTWGAEEGLLTSPQMKLMAIYHDNHEITEDNNLRTSICLAIPEEAKVKEEFSKMTIAEGTYAIGHFCLDTPEEHREAWRYMYGEWLPQSGREPADRPSFEVYLNDPNTHPEKKHFIDIYLPVKKS